MLEHKWTPMPDVIPGAEYYDTTFGYRVTCIGTEIDDGDDVVILQYEHLDEPVHVAVDLFESDSSFVIDEKSV